MWLPESIIPGLKSLRNGEHKSFLPQEPCKLRLKRKGGQSPGIMQSMLSTWASSSGERIGVTRHRPESITGYWVAGLFSASSKPGQPLWETWLKWGQSHFPHASVLSGNSLSYFSCIQRRGRIHSHCWNMGGKKGLNTSSLHNSGHFS